MVNKIYSTEQFLILNNLKFDCKELDDYDKKYNNPSKTPKRGY